MTPAYDVTPPPLRSQDGKPVDPPTLPKLNLCSLEGEGGGLRLHLPQSVRSEWLLDPIRSREWRAMLAKFGRSYTLAGTQAEANGAAGEAPVAVNAAAATIKKVDDLQNVCQTIAGPPGSNIMFKITEGPELWVCASGGEGCLDTKFALCHGAGTWLVEAKCDKFMEELSVVQPCSMILE